MHAGCTCVPGVAEVGSKYEYMEMSMLNKKQIKEVYWNKSNVRNTFEKLYDEYLSATNSVVVPSSVEHSLMYEAAGRYLETAEQCEYFIERIFLTRNR